MVISVGGEVEDGSHRFNIWSHPWSNSSRSLQRSVDSMSEISTARRQAKRCSTGERYRVFFTRVEGRIS